MITSAATFATAQNNAIFKGGNADGWVSKNSVQANTNIYKGGSVDGWASSNFSQSITNIYKGGNADGWASLNFSQSTTSIFKGGIADGWDSKNFVQSNTSIYRGGIGDGWDSKKFIQSNLGIYKGGIGDGWASSYLPQGPLPVTFLSFNAKKLNETSAVLNWKTSQEQNSSYFQVERSNDALHYFNIGRVAASGNSTTAIDYYFTDTKPAAGINYYRLKQVDIDGKFVYTPTRLVQFDEINSAEVKYYPNPTNSILNIIITEKMRKEEIVINISNASGAVVDQLKINANSNSIISVDLSRFAKAVYFVQVKSNTTNSTQRIILN